MQKKNKTFSKYPSINTPSRPYPNTSIIYDQTSS
jgi:hypothetical protein